MKTSLVICIFLAVHCYGRSFKVKRQASQSCKSVEYDLGMVEFNQFVTNEMKAEVCTKNIVNYNSHSRIPIKYLGGEYNYITHQNPCTVVCRYDPASHESIVDVHSTSVEQTDHEVQPAYTLTEYRTLPMGLFNVAEKTVCGPQHMCDASGCCVKEEPVVEQPEEHKEPETPVVQEPEAPQEPHQEPETPEEQKEPEVPEEHKEPETPEVPEHKEPEVPEEHKEPETPVEHKEPEVPEEHKEPETPEEHKEPETPEEHKEPQAPEEPHQEPETPEHKEPETPEEHKEPETPEEHKEPETPEEHKEPQEPEEPHKEPEVQEPEQPKEPEVPEKEYACKESGVFADDEDESSFFLCYLKSAHLKCAPGTVFSKGVCQVKDPHYEEHISCAHEGYFRNPYDCSRFYRCYFNDAAERAAGHLRLAFYSCSNSMVFDNTAQTCVLPSATQACVNQQLTV